jgi:hypothetical protein
MRAQICDDLIYGFFVMKWNKEDTRKAIERVWKKRDKIRGSLKSVEAVAIQVESV